MKCRSRMHWRWHSELRLEREQRQMAMLRKVGAAVLYHYPCPDGAFAALAAHLYFSSLSTTTSTTLFFFPNTVYSPLTPRDLPLSQIDSVYLLDFVGPPGFLLHLSSLVRR